MGLLGALLSAPVLGPPKLLRLLALAVCEEAHRESYDEGALRAELLELEELYQAGEMDESAYAEREAALLQRLQDIREAEAPQAGAEAG